MIKDSLTKSLIGFAVLYVDDSNLFPVVEEGVIQGSAKSYFIIGGKKIPKAAAFYNMDEARKYQIQKIEQAIYILTSMAQSLKERLK